MSVSPLVSIKLIYAEDYNFLFRDCYIWAVIPDQNTLLQWNLSYPDLYIQAPPLFLLTVMKFGLDESTRKEPKGCCLLFCGLFILLLISTTWLLGDNTFCSPEV